MIYDSDLVLAFVLYGIYNNSFFVLIILNHYNHYNHYNDHNLQKSITHVNSYKFLNLIQEFYSWFKYSIQMGTDFVLMFEWVLKELIGVEFTSLELFGPLVI